MKFALLTASLIAVLGIASTVVQATEIAAIPVTPAQTKVLILPTLDETGDKPQMQNQHIAVGNHRLEYEFLTRGFQVIQPSLATKAARADDIDLDDPSGRGKSELKQLGTDLGATWVVSLAVVNVQSQDRNTFMFDPFNTKRGACKIEIRILDLTQDGWIANHFYQDTKTTTRVLGPVGTTGLFKSAVDTATQRSVANLLSPYPQTVTVPNEFGESDLIDK